MIIDSVNFSFTRPDEKDFEQGTTFAACNFCQEKAHTKLFAGRTDLIFIGCNLKNVDLDVPPAQAIDCLYNVHEDIDVAKLFGDGE